MELRQLRYFVSIVDLGSFTKAAEVLFITQPTLSWNIRKLEEEFGVTLLDRHFNGVQLTEMGTILYEGSRRNLNLVDSL
ncbi:MAG: LysR family transcriptional regulator, partial [Erysipelothrix sp.]|nr:LysR family transcriptional regulator [Erysipelothrix sp.]